MSDASGIRHISLRWDGELLYAGSEVIGEIQKTKRSWYGTLLCSYGRRGIRTESESAARAAVESAFAAWCMAAGNPIRPSIDLNQIKLKADEIISSISTEDRNAMGAVNWGNIGVVDVVRCQGMGGDEWIEVRLEEAAPDCKLGSYVRARLVKEPVCSQLSIEVLTEW